MTSPVNRFPTAASADAAAHFAAALSFETDCWDVHASFANSCVDFVLVDVRGPDLFAAGHVPGAINIPHGKLVAGYLKDYPMDTLFVVYCAGPHCNGGHKGAVRLAQLGRPVKLMIGGATGWLDEGFSLVTGD
ncbi:MAG: rhodanese-like domain-containing protein [Gammaproteobacteria bacterium]|nr:rhodanese-like domain-containing protein [Gammaproteobacteria bacterium]